MDNFENMEGMEPDTIIFEDEYGNEYEFAVRDYFFYNGDEYALLTEVGQEADENGEECIVCKVESTAGEDGEEEESFLLQAGLYHGPPLQQHPCGPQGASQLHELLRR